MPSALMIMVWSAGVSVRMIREICQEGRRYEFISALDFDRFILDNGTSYGISRYEETGA